MRCSIRVEPTTILFPFTYISSLSRFTIQIYNDTNRKLHFEWRRRGTENEDEKFIKSADLDDPEQRNNLQKNLEFQSQFFHFENNTGEIWPLRFQRAIVSFTPQLSILYQDVAYLYVVETGERVPVTLKGTGLAPEAQFSVQAINVGHIFLESILEYEVVLSNTGKASVDFALSKRSTPGLVFEFDPEEGTLPVNQSVTIHIKFIANMVGSFNEPFTYKVKGAVQGNPTINIYGKIIGPTFSINTKELVFGTVSYGFMFNKTIEIENKSEIPFDYTLRLSQDGSFSRREFSIRPCTGTLGKFSKQQVLIEFIPLTIQDYKLELYFDIAKYGEVLAAIPITATCICPDVQLGNTNIDLGNVFIGYCYKTSLELIDDTDYPAKYEFIPSTDSTQLQAKTVVPKPNGIIKPHDKTNLMISITPIQLGPLVLTQYLRIYGSDQPPIQFTVSAICIGPNIKLSQNIVDFGQINVLQDTKHNINITNDSLIPAIFTTSVESETGVFKCEPSEGTIPPNGNLLLSVIANLDDNMIFQGKLILIVQNLNPIYVPVRANGIGTTIRSSINMSKINMNYIFTERAINHEFILYNHGRKPQEIRWTQLKPKIEGPANAVFTFKIIPESIIIPPYDQVSCKMVFQCNRPASFTTGAQCYTTMRKKRTELFSPQIKGTFIRPLLQYSQQTIEFHHYHDIAAEEQETGYIQSDTPIVPSKKLLPSITHSLTIKNNAQLALSMFFDCPSPFSLSEDSYHLEPGESHEIQVTFNPSFKTDFISEVITKKITISFDEHPQVSYVTLKGFIEFPNVTFSPSTAIDFGNLMINTEQTKDIKISNNSELPVDLYWELFTGDKPVKNPSNTSKIFDIYPIRAHIESKSTDVVRFSFFAVADSRGRSRKYQGTAICHIVGGPEYTLSLAGGSAAIEYKIDPLHIDFGDINYKDRMHKTMTLSNNSDVPVSYVIKIPRACRFQLFLINPQEGVINQNETVSIHIQVIGGLPRLFNEACFVQIGHFDEIRIDVRMNCFIPQIQIDLPHTDDDPLMMAFNDKLLRERAKLKRVMSESDEEEPVHVDPTPDELSDLERKLFISRLTDRSVSNFNATKRNKKSRIDKSQEIFEYEGPISAKYLLNMGRIVFGQKIKREFKIKSPAPFPISFDIQTAGLDGTGFSINPVSFQDIPPGEEVTVTVSFNTKMRTNELIDDVEFLIPVILNEDMASLIVLRAVLAMPTLNFSKTHCDFGNVIVGQSYVVTIQLQNMNPVACEFKFGEAQFMNVIQRGMSQTPATVFTASPSTGKLQPASFKNVEITFSPVNEKSYSMQFPIKIKHNTQPSIITLRGYGVQLRVLFDPPELHLPPITPYSDHTTMDVKLINPTAYPITVLSSQFDLQLLVDQVMVEQTGKIVPQPEDESAIQFTNSKSAKFSICVIVSGVSGSGKTTVCAAISKYMDGAPVLSLKEIWKEILENPESSQAEFVEQFSQAISEQSCSNGFIIDGLDVLPDPPDLDNFLSHCLKTKNVDAELAKNPLMVFQHANLSGAEQALAYILAALDGHYVFHIALKAPESVLNTRDELIKARERRKKRVEQHTEKKMLFNMTEEQYGELTEEQQEEVDSKRQALRKRLLKSALEEVAATSGSRHHSSRHKSHSSASRSRGDKSSRRSHRSEKKEGNEGESKSKHHRPKPEGSDEQQQQQLPPKPRRKGGLPQEPIPKSVIQYQFIVGSIAQRLQEGGECFQVVDPIDLLMETSVDTACDNEDEDEDTGGKKERNGEEDQNEKPDEEAKANNRNPTPMPGSRSKDLSPPAISYSNMNTLVVNVTGTVDEINAEIMKFLPSLNSLKEKAFTKLIPQPRMITTVPDLKKITLQDQPDFFSLVVEEPTTDLSELFPDSRPQSSSGKRNGRKSRTSHSKDSQTPALPEDIDISKRTKRWEIEPKSEITLTVMFDGKLIGDYSDILTFNILNAKAETAKLFVHGLVAYPDINRNVTDIFPKTQRKVDNKISYTFATDPQEFHFGSILVVKDRVGKAQPHYHQTIKLENNSLFPTEITATLTDSGQKSIWWIEKPTFTVQPGNIYDFNFGAHPVIPDLYKTGLTFTIKDQPDPIMYYLVAEGCAPTIDMNIKTFDFEKLLLNQQKTLRIDLKNTGKLHAFWRLKGCNQLGPNFTFNQVEGTLKPKQVFGLTCMFTSSKPLIVKKNISIEVLDSEKARIFSTTQIVVTSEAFDVNFDFQFPKGLDHLMYGSLKVGQTKMIPCILKNKGKYPSLFKICIANQRVQKLFNISPLEGTLQPGNNPTTINFSFCANRIVNFTNMKGISLCITDSLTNTITAELPLSFSATTLYSSFTVEPLKSIDFGSTAVNVMVTKQFKISNTGVFPFEYEIMAKPNGAIIPIETVIQDTKNKKKTPVRTPPSGKGRPRKGNEKNVQVGSFLFVPSVGVVQPNGTATIDVDFNCALPGFSKSTTSIKITDVDPKAVPDGIQFDVSGNTYIPGIETTLYDQIFEGTHLCLRFDLARITNTTAFLEDEQVLHFAPLILQQKETVPVTLINPQPIPIIVDINITTNNKAKVSKANFPFEVSDKTVNIPPNGKATVKLSFLPVTQDKFQAVFEALVRNGTNPDTKCLRFGIEAIGTLPNISMLSQQECKSTKANSFTFNLGKTLVGFTKDKTIAIKNDGLINARLSIAARASPDFVLNDVETTEEFVLEQDRILNLPVIFQPEKVRKSQFDIAISVLDNPKASLNLVFTGEGYSEDVSFEGLSDDDGTLIFKDNIVGRQLVSSFTMRNVSTNDIKFHWNSHNDFVFSPSCGHLRLGKTKTIKVVFFSEKPQKLNALKIMCQWNKITMKDIFAPDWDDTQKIVKFLSKGQLKQQQYQQALQQYEAQKQDKLTSGRRKGAHKENHNTHSSSNVPPTPPEPEPSDEEIVRVTEIKPEPENTIIQGKYKDLMLKVNAISDYIKYSLDTTEIEFAPTMMYQSRVVECKLTNTSMIRFEYQWIVAKLQCLRTEYGRGNKPPFYVQPNSGYIEAGQSTTFKVKFAPEEVDDFSAVLICDIPYLSQMKPPEIVVTGFSRRPLCHFNVEMSDYISSGRRHPDYTQELPEDVKVIEIFSPAVGSRSTKKFDIINPTSAPYEIAWSVVYDTSHGSIFCDTPNAFVSSGKKHVASFTYLPSSVKTVEKLFEFQIPEHNVRVTMLIVGRIMPNSNNNIM
ncbi:hypothetical protein TRFO_07679 [Tritrichomonas foetus]|uniref:Abnormal spindle-like microcephaly-associated protein ASH domain-containing protein n=1 Tax=Tritrichomonas foetus TaxID=1144522 RepID=A0A1J4JUT2_9EUKA|nr:hypothetical protein TRFO_07679 [Tritrichomonas foetus]|eukprot:OHT01013.1 hypothetical protein TRFO_07679 [Tritrichomonas foetus]